MDGLTLDQLRIFLSVSEAGSFSAAARTQCRATSAVTYAVEKIENQLGVQLFDRSRYRPTLTEAGRALLPRAQRIVAEVEDLRVTAQGIASGLEASVAIAIDTMFPMAALAVPLQEFQQAFPSVQLRILAETLGSSARLVADGACAIGLVGEFFASGLDLSMSPSLDVPLVMVASPQHPLSSVPGPIEPDVLAQHVQLVLGDPSGTTGSKDFSVYSGNTWRLSDLAAKQEMLRAGLGYGSLPHHLAANDLATGHLAPIEVANFASRRLSMVLVQRVGVAVGPATTWLAERLRHLNA